VERDAGTVVWETRGSAAWIYLSRPERMNALTPLSVREMWNVLNEVERDPAIRVAVITGRGSSFCAGMEFPEVKATSPVAARRRSREVQSLVNRIAEASLPTIAAVNGLCMGAGMEMCLACDLALAVTGALFGFAEVRLGMIPHGGGTQRLVRLVGVRRAREMVLAGRIIDAETAASWGLVNEVVAPEELETRVGEWVERLAQGARFALYQAKRCLNRSLEMGLDRGQEYEAECFATCFGSGEPAVMAGRFAPAQGGTVAEESAASPSPEEEPTMEGAQEAAGNLLEEDELFE